MPEKNTNFGLELYFKIAMETDAKSNSKKIEKYTERLIKLIRLDNVNIKNVTGNVIQACNNYLP